MTNFEKYKDEILRIVSTGDRVAFNIETKTICACEGTVCTICEFDKTQNTCNASYTQWLYKEYISPVDWSKVPVDARVWVSNDGETWTKMHFARYKNGEVYVWGYGRTSWHRDEVGAISVKYAKLAEEN